MKRILYIVLLAVLLFPACTSEEVPGEKPGSENIEVLFSVSNYQITTVRAATRATQNAGNSFEQAINDFYLFLFPGSGNTNPVRKYYIDGTGVIQIGVSGSFGTYAAAGKKVSLNLTKAEAGNRDVYIVANTAGITGLQAALNGVTTLSGLQAVLSTTATPWSPALATPILMSGSESHDFMTDRVLGTGAAGNEPLRLVRALAKIELNITLKAEHKSAAIADYKYKYTNFHKETNVIKKATSTGSDKYASSSASVWPITTGWTPWGSALDTQGMGSAHTVSGGVVTTLKLVTYVNERDDAGAAIEIEVPYNGSGPLPPPEFGPELYKLEFPEGIQRNYWYVHEIEI
ncbi:MAG: hypothetical protein BGO34_21125 [Bacteroidia bacterium 44-10]|nr:MAG: hypothetical protein BGO34_21125 [Bacteroidia bacterium 44-10]